jgi:hypothetical protein
MTLRRSVVGATLVVAQGSHKRRPYDGIDDCY